LLQRRYEPAAGKSTRIHGLPQFLLPVPDDEHLPGRTIKWMREAHAEPVIIGPSPRVFVIFQQYREEPSFCIFHMDDMEVSIGS